MEPAASAQRVFLAVVVVAHAAVALAWWQRPPLVGPPPPPQFAVTILAAAPVAAPAPAAVPAVPPLRPASRVGPPPAARASAPSPAIVTTKVDVAPAVAMHALTEAAPGPSAAGSQDPAVATTVATPASAQEDPAAPIAAPRLDAEYLDNAPPPYPPLARQLREQGVVLLDVRVAASGTPEAVQIRVSSGSTRLDEAARAAVARWRFVPATQGSTPVAAWVVVPVRFALRA